ncbi:MAG: hypothetical protein PVH77_05985 [Phycisphaerales bacterium]|jgi:hypothetical protein
MKNGILFQVLFLIFVFLQTISNAATITNDKYALELKIHCPLKRIKQGDEIPIVFTITNKDKRAFKFEKRDYDRSGRMVEYALYVWGENGKAIPDPRENVQYGLAGGLGGGTGTIFTGQSFSRTIPLNLWALIKAPGRYTVKGNYSYFFDFQDPNTKEYHSDYIQVESEPIEITVKRRGHWWMGRYIKKLLRELKSVKPSPKPTEASVNHRGRWWRIKYIINGLKSSKHSSALEPAKQRKAIISKLNYTCDERIVPTLIDLMYNSQHTNEAFWAAEGFRCYLPKTAEIKNQLLKTVREHGLVPGMPGVLERYDCDEQTFKEIIGKSLYSDKTDILRTAVGAAHNHPNDGYTNRLVELAIDVNSPVRIQAIYAIAFNRTDKGVKTLKTLLKDNNQEIQKITEDAVRQAYRRHWVYPEIVDEEYTSELVSLLADAKEPSSTDPTQTFLLIEIARTRTKEGIEAIKTLLENPDKDIALAQTDEGVKAIRNFLRTADEDTRNMTTDTIRFIYKTYPGRSLKNDDFPEEFRENTAERKMNFLERIRNW